MTEHKYIIHDAEKEKPKLRLICGLSVPVLGFFAGQYDKVFYDTRNNSWFRVSDGLRVTITHWTSLPPDPPKPRRWVKKEIQPNVVQVKEVGPVNFDVFAEAYGLPKVRNVMLTYEIEEDQP